MRDILIVTESTYFSRVLASFVVNLLLFIPARLIAAEPTATIPPTPQFRIEETIASYRGTGTMDYLAFPAIVPSGENEIMISYKRGKSHGSDPGAVLEIIRVDLKSGRQIQDPIQLGIADEIMQMGEWIRFPNGTLGT